MDNDRVMRVGGSRSLDLATYASTGLMGAIGVLGLADPLPQVVAAGLCLASALLYRFASPRAHSGRGVTLYLAAQTAVLTPLLAMRTRSLGAFVFLFFLLALQASIALPRRTAVAWIAGLYVITSVSYLWQQGRAALISVLFDVVVFLFSGTFGRMLRATELARQRSESLLEELQAAQRQLQILAIAEERNRLARDLHDSTKQQAFALSAQLGAVRGLLKRDPKGAEDRLLQAEQLADHLRQELADLILDLRPSAPGDQGLAAALRTHAAAWSRQSDIEVEVQVQGERALSGLIEHTLFRIAQEALANVARHSRARRARVQLEYSARAVTLAVEDDGQGYDPEQAPLGVGTQSMRERAATLPAGTLRVDSEPGKGTRLTVSCEA